MSLREDIEALADKWERDGGAEPFAWVTLRAILTKPPTTPRIRTERRELI